MGTGFLHGIPMLVLVIAGAVILIGVLAAVVLYVGGSRRMLRRRKSEERVVMPEAAMNDAPLPASLKEGEATGGGTSTGHHGGE